MSTQAPLYEDTPIRRNHLGRITWLAPIAGGDGTEEPEAPETGTEADTTDWKDRYDHLQPEYTRTTQQLKDEQKVWEDEQAVLARIQEKFPHLIADDTDETEEVEDDAYDDDDPRFAELAELKKKSATYDEWIANQVAKEDRAMFDTDLATEAGERELSAKAKKAIWNETLELGGGRENLKKALASWIEYEDGLGEQYMERVKKSKRAPHMPANGKATTDTPDWSQLSEDQQAELMAEQVRARLSS